MRFILLIVLAVAASVAQEPHGAGKLLLVLPFENKSTAPGLEWIGEAFPEVMNQRMEDPSLFIIQREDRLFAFDRMGVPATATPSRATVFTVAQAMDVDYVVLGSYNYDGRTFSTTAQVLDMQNLHLGKAFTESGALTDLINIQTVLAYDLLGQLQLRRPAGQQQFMARQPQVRLDSLENYVRGVIASTQADKIRRFKEAVRISPDYDYAKLQLARTYFQGRDYEQAATWFAKVPRSSARGAEANFFYGICEYQLGDMSKAEEAFQFVASRLPLTEVENNLGVVTARKNRAAAAEMFRRAVQADPRDADYRFNYAVALAQGGETAEAVRQVKEALTLRPGDGEARALSEQLAGASPVAAVLPAAAGTAAAAQRTFYPRLKRNYDETTFRQAALEMHNVEEIGLAAKGAEGHAASHVARGNELLGQGFVAEAEAEFREAVGLDARLAGAHVGLAKAALRRNDRATANSEVGKALKVDPEDVDALSLKREMEAKAGR